MEYSPKLRIPTLFHLRQLPETTGVCPDINIYQLSVLYIVLSLMAYAALVSLGQTLEQQILLYDDYPVLLPKEKLVLLQTRISTILAFVQDYSDKFGELMGRLEDRIIDAAFRVEDIIESHLCYVHLSVPGGLQKLMEEIDLILEDVVKIKNNFTAENNFKVSSCSDSDPSPSLSSRPLLGAENAIVGLKDDFNKIKGLLYQEISKLQVIPIVGMGGMGKTTLARRVYKDSVTAEYFDRLAWVVVSQEYDIRTILLGVIQSISTLTDDQLNTKSVEQLALIVHKELVGRRYLFVIDDVWSTKAWDDLKKLFPNDDIGSRILLTTRQSDVAAYVSSSSNQFHEMPFLDEDQSWTLLQQRVFADQSCPPYLEETGRRIARTCQGLALTIVVVAGLLKGDMTTNYWENISENISSKEPTIAQNCSKILSLSYDHLPLHLKPCFIYLAAFPEDCEIDAQRIVMLWVAEGFPKPSGSKSLEEVAEGYLDDLVRRNLLLVGRKRSNGKIRYIRIHDLWRDICTMKAKEKRFVYHAQFANMTGEGRRLSIFNKYLKFDTPNHNLNPVTRSLLIFCSGYSHLDSSINGHRLLRILYAPIVVCHLSPRDIMELVNLRYLAFTCSTCNPLSGSLYRLQNLKTLMIRVIGLPVAIEFWKVPQLRHLMFYGRGSLILPSNPGSIVETDLQTLSLVENLDLTDEVIEMILNVRKLGLRYCYGRPGEQNSSYLNNLIYLPRLEILKIKFSSADLFASPSESAHFAFPGTLKKLTLERCQIPWEDMSKIGSLPNLEVLKLKWYACKGPSWYPVEGEFLRLKYLEYWGEELQHWEADSVHFPSLETLVLQSTGWYLKKIPPGIGDIGPLQLIELHRCEQSIVASAKGIQEEQRDMGNDSLQVLVFSQ